MTFHIVDIQRRRLIQLFWATELLLVVMLGKGILEQDPQDMALITIIGLLATAVPVLIRHNHQTVASGVFAILLTLLVILIMWTSSGIKNNAVVALPGLFVFVALIGGHRYYFPLVAIVLFNVFLMGWLSELAWFNPSLSSHSLSSAFDIIAILLLCAFGTYVMSRDNSRLVEGLQTEIVKVEQSHQEMTYLANHDVLTGLPNRTSAEMAFNAMTKRLGRQEDTLAAVFFIDLDEFKEVNDTLGHDVGDQYLVQVSDRLQEALRTTDQIFRIGGDEFLLFLENIKQIDDLVTIAEKLRANLSLPVTVDERLINCSGSIGMVVVPTDADSYQEAVKRADIAMYRSKESGKNCFHFYNPDMEQDLQDRVDFQNDMQQALVERQLRVQFQPIVSMDQEQIIGAEALIRWQHPQKGLIAPYQFISLAEKSDLINDLSRFVLEEACSLLADILPAHPDFYISVNLSPVQLRFPGLTSRIMTPRAIELAPHLKLEVTESQIIESMDTFRQNVEAIRELGFGLFLDDFGTGYSNLGHLQKLQFETLKIDRSFIQNIHERPDQLPLVRGITNLAKDLGLKVVVEGVETQAELAALRQLDIANGQGYFWSRPLDIPALKTCLQDQTSAN
ncbi:putative bifunctional diguanylate cyclase/phosphodiesterase [Reinekea blandensis]|uniref:Sensory box sensor/GGDEF/EAL domain protein n=1 Tax=Reinekea blandensis MED297 TaxID=314283 RepID=A4BJ14_9GAMM|nr:EAL domain-containing protein [Reinekea blandensis]EAR07859.1 sensory box sensor/GGDEF/EAL domain protein [Reinekea sp. MED297] [Reinekea blandensis MED297]